MVEEQISDDGRWKWDGEEWIPIDGQPSTNGHNQDEGETRLAINWSERFAFCPKCSQMLKIPSENPLRVSCPMCSEEFSPEISDSKASAMEGAKKKRCKQFNATGSRCRNEFVGPGKFCEEHAATLSQSWQKSEKEKREKRKRKKLEKPPISYRISEWRKYGLQAEDSASNAKSIFFLFIFLNIVGGLVIVTDDFIQELGLSVFFIAVVIIEIMFLILIYSMWNSIYLHLSLRNKMEIEGTMDSLERSKEGPESGSEG